MPCLTNSLPLRSGGLGGRRNQRIVQCTVSLRPAPGISPDYRPTINATRAVPSFRHSVETHAGLSTAVHTVKTFLLVCVLLVEALPRAPLTFSLPDYRPSSQCVHVNVTKVTFLNGNHRTRSRSSYRSWLILQGLAHLTGPGSTYRACLMLQGLVHLIGSGSSYRAWLILQGLAHLTGSGSSYRV